MRLNLVHHPESPLMYPNPVHQWEAFNVFNCAVTQHNGLFHMHYIARKGSISSRASATRSAQMACIGTGWLTPFCRLTMGAKTIAV